MKEKIKKKVEKQLLPILAKQHSERTCRYCGKFYDTKPMEDWNLGRDSHHFSCRRKYYKETGRFD